MLADPDREEFEDYVTWLGGQGAGDRPFDAGTVVVGMVNAALSPTSINLVENIWIKGGAL